MKTFFREKIKTMFPDFYWNSLIIKRVVKNKESFLHKSGWYNSLVEGKPLNDEGEEIPWLNYGIFNFLKDRLQNNFIMFEYGSGASTVYFSKKVKKVVSVEHDKEWYEKVMKKKPINAELSFQHLDVNGKYAQKILQYDYEFDIVLVDGRDRMNCIKHAVSKLSPSGVIILDNSNRERYLPIFDWEGLRHFRSITFTGILPGGFKPDATTIFYRPENCLGI